MTLPAYVVWFRGLPACPCLKEWLPAFEAELRRRGVIREAVDIAQLIGGAAASGGTHAAGGAFDIWQHDPITQEVAREMGAAAWNRIRPWWTGSPHTHGVLNGCPHNGPAAYQIAALADGYSGLGKGGRGSRDYGPGPRRLRTWRDGIEWAKRQGDDMQPEDWKRLDQRFDQLANLVKKGDEASQRRDRTLREKFVKPLVALVGDVADAIPDVATRAQVKRQADRIIHELDSEVD